jgi:hypothetical protein
MSKKVTLIKGLVGNHDKEFCLNCRVQTPCKCHDEKSRFYYSHRLRPPKVHQKGKFRKFLDACPSFSSSVETSGVLSQFLDLLEYVNYDKNGWHYKRFIKD